MADISEAMTPWEFAHELQKQSGLSESHIAVEACDVIAVNILGALPADQRAILEKYPVIVLPTRQPNAICVAVPSGGAVIAIDYGLLSFLNVLNKVMLSRLNLYGMEPALSLTEATAKVRVAIDHFWGSVGEVPRWPVSPRRMLIASALSNVQVSFVVGHELGHVLLGHLDEHLSVPLVESKVLSASVFSFAQMHEQEFAADKQAARMVIEHFSKVYDPLFGPNEPSYSQAGTDIFFSYLELLDSVMGLPSETPTHPPTSIRREKLREAMWHTIPEPSRKLADSFAEIAKALASMLTK